ncbi:HEAVY METAL ASSOCIATED PROTEIN 53, EAVY METAL-ASSOCIATED ISOPRENYLATED PLANT PROTEIN3 [Hibiscus trionum]|uniref:HEAVY METAL ASSOCIATED PROTEIN 53, EAVY METAL-ASSOCIATED ISOPRENYLATED PLANT PROTEIN3 n=1 Tax=Hibiscus trionum TaxID=183268 RepID=A0A9W7J6I1_HIBTR|nr:HEAVY METAL ASSOCIATED PROTEIN 53, EAVY METAL-ASSOCIATED ISOPRENYLATED PLANT PROTEIN3 [Hibiscus trionum]
MGEKNKGGDGEKKEKGSSTSVFKVDCLCDGCAIKLLKCIRALQGVETITTESSSNKVTVTGPVDPTAIKEILVKKTKKRVDIISPQPKKVDDKEKKKEKKADKEKNQDSGNANEKKPKEAPVTTVDLKVQLKCPCQGCIVKIRKIVADTKGVHELKVDRVKELVTVKGTMDVKALAEALKDKLRKNAEIVPLKKEKDGKNEGSENAAAAGGDGGSGKKKNKGGNGGAGGGGNEAAATGCGGGSKMEGNRMEFIVQPQFGYMPSYPGYGHPAYGYGYGHQHGHGYPGYVPGYPVSVHPPHHLFNDENPNACAIM